MAASTHSDEDELWNALPAIEFVEDLDAGTPTQPNDGKLDNLPDEYELNAEEDDPESFKYEDEEIEYELPCSFVDENNRELRPSAFPAKSEPSCSQSLPNLSSIAGIPFAQMASKSAAPSTPTKSAPLRREPCTVIPHIQRYPATPPTRLGKRKAESLPSSPINPSPRPKKKAKTCKLVSDSVSKYAKIQVESNKSLPEFITNNVPLQQLFDSLSLSYGVRWELGRLVSVGRLQISDILDNRDLLHELQGPNAVAAGQTAVIFCGGKLQAEDRMFEAENSARNPWPELDKELTALSVDPYAGLGHSTDPNYSNLKWYGGKVTFSAKLDLSETTGKYSIRLLPAELGPSNRAFRRFGSWTFIKVKVNQKFIRMRDNQLEDFFGHPICLWGFVFRAFYAKDENVFLLRTNEVVKHGLVISPSSPSGGLTFEEFIAWANPPEFNQNQLMCKWAARMALMLSNSVPGPMIPQHKMFRQPDIVNKHPVTGVESEMTDGCGLASRSLFVNIYTNYALPGPVPSTIQMRFEGIKGLLTTMRDYSIGAEEMEILSHDSQHKINYDNRGPVDPAHEIVDILRTSHLKSPARISAEVIRCLEDNGVPARVFKDLIDAQVKEVFESLTRWADPQYDLEKGGEPFEVMLDLYVAVEKSEGVVGARRARAAGGEARFRGMGERNADDAVDEDGGEGDEDGLNADEAGQKSTAWWPDYVSGSPSSLAETVMALLDAGFTPRTSPVLRAKLEKIVEKKIKYKTSKIRFEVPQSLATWVVPDETGTLEKGEIHVKSSRNIFKTPEGVETDVLVGDVLITRNPCKVGTDVQKVKAVQCPALLHCVDVIVVNTKDYRRLLDLLSGGDYDGDRCIVIWDLLIVNAFTNAPIEYADPAKCVERAFERDQLKVSQFLVDTTKLTVQEKRLQMQKYLFSALRDTSALGKYSVFHDNAIHKFGYSHPTTRQLAAKFNTIMDSAKSGYRLLESVYQRDKRAHDHSLGPRWKVEQKRLEHKGKPPRWDKSNAVPLRRDWLSNCPSAKYLKGRDEIMNVLYDHALKARDHYLSQLETRFNQLPAIRQGDRPSDLDLDEPWYSTCLLAQERARRGQAGLQRDLDRIKEHVATTFELHLDRVKRDGDFTNLPIVKRQDTLRECSKFFSAHPSVTNMESLSSDNEIARLCASYAYRYDWEQRRRIGFSRFPFDVAFRTLCEIKSKKMGPSKPMLSTFYERTKVIA